MQLVVPMAGFGERFRRAGYSVPKPMIEIEGRPIIEHVIDLFPGADEVVLLCSQEHLDHPGWEMEARLLAMDPRVRVVGVPPHREGPVRTVLLGAEHVRRDGEVIISVCDLNFAWDFHHFAAWVKASGSDGCVVSYRGFHPHLLNSVHYAFLRNEGAWATEIREKHAFTSDPIGQGEFCSNGVYWFRSGQHVLDYFELVAARADWAIAGEHYVSQAYQPMIEDGLAVSIYEIQHYLQWGNPTDVDEYLHHHAGFVERARAAGDRPVRPGTLLIPMAGLGQRFVDAGYTTPKPLIEVGGLPMVVQAARELPRMARTVFVLRADMPGLAEIRAVLEAHFPGHTAVVLDGPTDGQARTCVLGIEGADIDLSAPLVIGACDNGVSFDEEAHWAALEASDALVWAMVGHPTAARRPEMYGWIDAEEGCVKGLSVKKPLRDPPTDPAVIGTFSFRRAGDFLAACQRMFERDARVRNEFYVDTALEDVLALGHDLRVFVAGHYHGWGTPDELRTYTYWQSHFHKWDAHPYRLEGDRAVPADRVADLAHRYRTRLPDPLPPRVEGSAREES